LRTPGGCFKVAIGQQVLTGDLSVCDVRLHEREYDEYDANQRRLYIPVVLHSSSKVERIRL
jgi:hypothetical protein